MQNKTLLTAIAAGVVLSALAQAVEFKQGGTVTVPIITTGFVENFNPYTNGNMVGVMYEPVFVFNNMTGEMDYRLAESVAYSDDLKTITMKLRKGLVWSDGSPLTAKDVAYSYNLTKTVKAFDSRSLWTANKLKSVKATDAQTIVFELTKPDSTLIWDLASYYVVPKKVWSKEKNLTTFINPNPIGSGPMTQVKYVKPQQMELCRNNKYYIPNHPYLDCISFRSYSDNSQLQPALIKGEIDWGSNFIADVENTYVGKDKANHHFWYPANDAINLYVNTKRVPFNDLKVRQALSMALDRDAIVDIAAYGYPTANFNMGGLGELYKTSVDEKVNKEYRHLAQYNPKESKKLLDEAGIVDRNGDGWRDNKDGSTFEFDIDVVNGWTDWIQTVQMVTEYFAEVGVKSNINAVDWAVYDGNLKESKYDMSISWSLVSSDPVLAFKEYYDKDNVGVTYHVSHGLQSEEMNQLLDRASVTNDAAERQKIVSRMQEFTAQNVPFIPVFSNPTWFQYNSTKIEGWPSAENPYVQPVWYDGGKRVIILNKLHLK